MTSRPITRTSLAALAVRARWEELCRREGFAPGAAELAELLVSAYGEPGRHYHTNHHIVRGTGVLDALGADPLTKVAFYFHDAVYVPGASDNEARSAELFAAHAHLFPSRSTPGPCWEDEVTRLILLTARHEVEPGDAPGAQVVAADLWELGSSWDVHSNNTALIRREYAKYTEAEWRQGRAAFLETMLARPSLYPDLLPARAREVQARWNLAREYRLLAA